MMGLLSVKMKYRISFISIETFYDTAVLSPILYGLFVAH
jgi:hypothetical protein